MGVLVLLIGLGAAYWTFTDFQDASLQDELLDFGLARYQDEGASNSNSASREETAQIEAAIRPLATPWSALLNDLEAATQETSNDIALLEVWPDKAKHRVRISAEARTLQAALGYIKTLQNASSLLYPVLEKHEVRSGDSERPVRFEVAAEWSLSYE